MNNGRTPYFIVKNDVIKWIKSELVMKNILGKEGDSDGCDELQRYCATECNDI